ncbi:hypothetical protein [Leptospira ryugenii]|uniref:hypothetical protein n=1 Tax=Leptospira ryugenii TaxID=1917863 RepID=UPI000D59799A|nr:hypothetical protein [Leptospira ryugenii]
MDHCPRCGLTKETYEKLLKFACPDCYQVFEPNLGRFHLLQRQNPSQERVPRFPWLSKSYRIRITRSFRQGFFTYYERRQEEVETLLTKNGFTLGEKVSHTFGNHRFYQDGEDHLRWECISHSLPLIISDRFRIQNILFQAKLWAWKAEIGFLNSCPSNCGRGDRLSVQALLPVQSWTDWQNFQGKWEGSGILCIVPNTKGEGENTGTNQFLVQISIKNAVPAQKLRFFKILGLLGLA